VAGPLSRARNVGHVRDDATKLGQLQMTESRNAAIAPIKRRALRINDAAAAYGVGRSTLYKLMSQGKLATVKVAGRRLVPCDNMEALLRE
jgi:excisionase family DNA binding protein